MNHTILFTGATGFIGTAILKELIGNSRHRIIALVRAGDKKQAKLRLYRAFWEQQELCRALDGNRITVINGDITLEKLGLEEREYQRLKTSVSHIIHAAADLRLMANLDDLRRTNVEGTRHVLELASSLHKDKKLKMFSYISTAYVAGNLKGSVAEGALSRPRSFLSNYGQSKFEAEELVLTHTKAMPLAVFRPAMVVGDSQTGYIKTFNTIYALLKSYFTNKIAFIPLSPSLRINIIPVDYVARAVASLTFNPRAAGQVFNLTVPEACLPTTRELVEYAREWALTNCSLRQPRPVFLPLPLFILKPCLALLNFIFLGRRRIFKNLTLLAPYYYEKRSYKRSRLERLMGSYNLDWKALLDRLLRFAVAKGFLHRKAFTVQEQLCYRLGKSHLPVSYHEIRNKRIFTASNKKLLQEIDRACRALQALGIGKGDRVGIAAHNSLKYLLLDTALGLCGAVSLPLFAGITNPELQAMLAKINFKLFFTDQSEHLKLAGVSGQGVLFVSLTDLPHRLTSGGKGIMSWEAFMHKGHAGPSRYHAAPPAGDIGFDEPATVRFTSGTTGEIKQVPFFHRQLRWMAETLNSLFPWKYRLNPVRYLSFLPMNHVVEGILALYAPYFAPVKVDVYFLPNFAELLPALKKVKPTIFFSVPRFYEKIYESLAQKKIYQQFLRSKHRATRHILRYFLRKAILRRTGLKHCKQLISGSAPLATSLARRFRELGIEIHDAYGLSEAPLLTINRYAHNSLGSVGTPLPETEIKIAPDGEILARGPQVSPGCISTAPAQGFLQTGDMGYINKKGELVINGRKKEILVTAYGKNIHPLTIENLLKEIAIIKEAVVVGEGKPYLSALLWTDAERLPPETEICKAISGLNQRLSPPQRIRKFALLRYDLAVCHGDFTASYKLVREAICKRFQKIIDALYNGSPPIAAENLICTGDII